MPSFDIYAALGVPKTATPEQIKAAHRRLVRCHHPDRDRTAISHERFLRIQQAYEVLSDVELRREYDSRVEKLRRENEAAHEHEKQDAQSSTAAQPSAPPRSSSHAAPASPLRRDADQTRLTAKAASPLSDVYAVRDTPNTAQPSVRPSPGRARGDVIRHQDAGQRRTLPINESDSDYAKDIALSAAPCVAVLVAIGAAVMCILDGNLVLALVAAPAVFVLYTLFAMAVTYPLAGAITDVIRFARWLGSRLLGNTSADTSRPVFVKATAMRVWAYSAWVVLCLSAPFIVSSLVGPLEDQRLQDREWLAPLLVLAVVFDVQCLYAGTVWLCLGLRQVRDQAREGQIIHDDEEHDVGSGDGRSQRAPRYSRAVRVHA